jgi:hypothetical protein
MNDLVIPLTVGPVTVPVGMARDDFELLLATLKLWEKRLVLEPVPVYRGAYREPEPPPPQQVESVEESVREAREPGTSYIEDGIKINVPRRRGPGRPKAEVKREEENHTLVNPPPLNQTAETPPILNQTAGAPAPRAQQLRAVILEFFKSDTGMASAPDIISYWKIRHPDAAAALPPVAEFVGGLRAMVAEGRLECIGRGAAAFYREPLLKTDDAG